MSDWHRASSRAAIGLVCVGALFVGGCAFIYNFDDYKAPPKDTGASGSGGAGGSGASTSSGGGSTSSSGSGAGGGGGGGCNPAAPDCGLRDLMDGPTVSAYGDITISETYVYWVSDYAIRRYAKDTDKVDSVLYNQLRGVYLVAAAGDDAIYFAYNDSNGSGVDVSHPSGSGDPFNEKTIATGIAVNSDILYWLSADDSKVHKGSMMDMAVALTDDTGASPARIAGSPVPGEVFWTYQGPGTSNGGVRQLGVIDDFEGGQDKPSGIAVDIDAVYWMTKEGTVHRKGKAQGDPVVSVVGGTLPGASMLSGRVAVSGNYVYWLGPDEETCKGINCTCDVNCGTVWAAPKDLKTAAAPFARGKWTFKDIAADDKHVYWTVNTANGTSIFQKPIIP